MGQLMEMYYASAVHVGMEGSALRRELFTAHSIAFSTPAWPYLFDF